MNDLYEILGVERTASPDEIKKAYRKKSKSAHPDSGGSEEAFHSVQHAFEVLTDPTRRRHYDDTGHDNAMGDDQILSLLAEQWMQIVEKHGIHCNTMKKLRASLTDSMTGVLLKIERISAKNKKIQKLQERIIRKNPGKNAFSELVQTQIAKNAQEIQDLKSFLHTTTTALKLLEDFEDTFEVRKEVLGMPFFQRDHGC